ncbi:SAVED domain-containing protein [Lacibacter sp.]|uniref:SAVED domain-containing protein n=1 Tax=Lacibacter sp. TaxID=1915409 RepID=UPI002B4B6BFD|nr:SAVED domain-containing protein [Lacibacter sp.]HLP37594.1 SAVED domain-containing protein [Lacibacter sp.]
MKIIVIAHYGLDRKITKGECVAALGAEIPHEIEFIDFEAGHAKLSELYDLPFENLALAQQRKFAEILKPVLDNNPDAHIAYFGLTPIPISFHLGYLVGNTHTYTVYQLHHKQNKWLADATIPYEGYKFEIVGPTLPKEIQKGKGDVAIRIGTSFNVDPQSTYEVLPNPANEFDITLETPHVDSLFSQKNIQAVVESFQEVLNAYANKLTDREQIHLFVAGSAGLPFALGTRINPTIYPYIQTYQFSREQTPKYREAILITKEINDRVDLDEKDKEQAHKLREAWESQLQNKLKPFIKTITARKWNDWVHSVCESDDEYNSLSSYLKRPWSDVINLGLTTLKDDKIDLSQRNIDDGFEYIEKTNSWLLDDGFLSSVRKRLEKNANTDIMQAGRLFLFHEALHYSSDGHRLTREVANGIGQFPKVIEEADYQADVWALLTEYKYCCIYEPDKLRNGIKEFFCNAIESAVETMWSFMDTGIELSAIQIRGMNRFLNWYWQWTLIENIKDKGSLVEIVQILLDKPIIEFAGVPLDLRGYRTYYKLNVRQQSRMQLSAFAKNRVYRFASNEIQGIVDGFRQLNGEKVKAALKSYQVTL